MLVAVADPAEGAFEPDAFGVAEQVAMTPLGLDAGAFGAARPALMRDFLGRSETAATATTAGDGFAMVRAGRRAWQAGPVVAPSETAAMSLIERLFSGVSGEVFIDVPQIWSRLGGWLAARGFTIQRSFTPGQRLRRPRRPRMSSRLALAFQPPISTPRLHPLSV